MGGRGSYSSTGKARKTQIIGTPINADDLGVDTRLLAQAFIEGQGHSISERTLEADRLSGKALKLDIEASNAAARGDYKGVEEALRGASKQTLKKVRQTLYPKAHREALIALGGGRYTGSASDIANWTRRDLDRAILQFGLMDRELKKLGA